MGALSLVWDGEAARRLFCGGWCPIQQMLFGHVFDHQSSLYKFLDFYSCV